MSFLSIAIKGDNFLKNSEQQKGQMIVVIIFGIFGFLAMYYSIELLGEGFIISIIYAGLCLIISFFIHILLHEIGHIIGGLLSGYQFMMFRLSNTLWIKTNEGISKRKQTIPGIAGQALMVPPKAEDEELPPFFVYHASGIIMNLLTAVALILLANRIDSSTISGLLILSAIVALFCGLTNAIPMRGTDGYNIVQQVKNKEARVSMLASMYMYQDLILGESFEDLQKYVTVDENNSFADPEAVSLYSLRGAYYLEKLDFEAARRIYETLWNHFDQLIEPHKPEVGLSYLFTLLLTEPTHPDINKIMQSKFYKNSLKVKQVDTFRLFATEALYLDDNAQRAQDLLDKGQQYISQAPTISEENLEIKLYEYLNKETKRRLINQAI